MLICGHTFTILLQAYHYNVSLERLVFLYVSATDRFIHHCVVVLFCSSRIIDCVLVRICARDERQVV